MTVIRMGSVSWEGADLVIWVGNYKVGSVER